MQNVPEPHSGSRNSAFCLASSGHCERISTPGGDVLLERRFAGRRAIAAAVQAVPGKIDGDGEVHAVGVRVHAHARTFRRDIGPRTRRRAQRIDDAVLELEGPEMRVRDRRMAATELAGERRLRPKVRRPVDAGDAVVEFRRVARLELRDLEEHPVGDARPQAGAVGALEWPGERDAPGALARPERTASGELGDQQIREAPGSAREKAQLGAHAVAGGGSDPQVRSSQVVFSSVYFSSACSDLSRPMPDCLKPPNGTVRSSAS